MAQKLDAIRENLAKRKTAKPATLKSLRSTINALFGKKLDEAEIDQLVEQLRASGEIGVVGEKVNYKP